MVRKGGVAKQGKKKSKGVNRGGNVCVERVIDKF